MLVEPTPRIELLYPPHRTHARAFLAHPIQFGSPLLHCAIAAGHMPVVQHLLDAGADPTYPDVAHRTALHIAAEHGASAAISAIARSEGESLDVDAQTLVRELLGT